jgi:hypothetical protein
MVSTHASRNAALLASAVLFAACADPSGPSPAPAARDPQLARSPQAQERLEAIFQRVSPDVMALPAAVFTDNDEVAGKVVIGIERGSGAHGQVRAAMARLGVDEGDFAIEETAPIVNMATLRDRFRPTQAGIQLHWSRYVCTLGFNVDHAGGRSFITNSHCTNTQGGVEGTTYAQPTRTVDPTVIATEVADPAYVKGGSCPKGKKCRWADASRALYSSGVASNRGEIAKTTGANNGSLTVNGLFTITSQDNSSTSFPVGTVLNKVGRTTGWTQGPVQRTCVNSSVSGSQVYLYCQTFVTAGVGGGDSGSPVFRITSGDNVQLVGILWGGASDNSYFVMSPLNSIQRELGTVTATK